MRVRWGIGVLLAARVALADTDEGEGPRKTISAVRAARAPVIDGRLDDEVWAIAPPDDRFTQTQPDEGKPPSERTEVRVAYDDRNVYFGVRCFDSEPDQISSKLTRRDRDIETDWLALYIDSRHDHSSALIFQLSPAGVQVDGEMYNDTQYSPDWDGVWSGAVSTDDQGWVAEFAIPLTLLRFSDAPEQTWGLQVHRNVSRRREQSMWAYTPSRFQGLVSHFGQLVGIRGIHPSRTLELRPYGVARVRGRALTGAPVLGFQQGSEIDASTDVGVDAKLGLTRGLTLDATVNPDFGQVEADQVVLNLTHFETFFPEKRPFFLEGREVFETPLTLFYPRRIGRPPVGLTTGDTVVDGRGRTLRIADSPGALPIWTAAKVSGTVVDHLGIGAVGALTGAERAEASDGGEMRTMELAPKRGYAGLRAKVGLGGNAYLGAAATFVNRLGGQLYSAAANHDAYAQAVDGRWQALSGRWRVEGQAVMSERIGGTSHATADGRPCPDPAADPSCVPVTRADGTTLGPGDVGAGGQAHVAYTSEHVNFDVNARSLSPRLDINDMGFLPDFNTHQLDLTAAYVQRHPGSWYQRYSLIPEAHAAVSWDSTPQNGVVGAHAEVMTKGFVFTLPQLLVGLPGTFDDFETFDGAHFEKPAYVDASWMANTNPSHALSGQLKGEIKRELGARGITASVSGSIAWQPRSNLELGLEPQVGWDQNAVRFYSCMTASSAPCVAEQGARHYLFADLDSRFFSVVFRGTYTFIPTLSLQAYAQAFLADGTYSRFRAVDTMGAARIHRGDLGPTDFTTDDGFAETTLNLNVVLRWEPVPGSTLFGVYTRAQEAPRFGLGRLGEGPTEDVFLLKLVYYVI
jgi:uncharacterized protein DUF5916/cellulose/xylan binding protein with CBM9 domain